MLVAADAPVPPWPVWPSLMVCPHPGRSRSCANITTGTPSRHSGNAGTLPGGLGDYHAAGHRHQNRAQYRGTCKMVHNGTASGLADCDPMTADLPANEGQMA